MQLVPGEEVEANLRQVLSPSMQNGAVILWELFREPVPTPGQQEVAPELHVHPRSLCSCELAAQEDEGGNTNHGLHPAPSPCPYLHRCHICYVLHPIRQLLASDVDSIPIRSGLPEDQENATDASDEGNGDSNTVGERLKPIILLIELAHLVQNLVRLAPPHLLHGHDLAQEALAPGTVVVQHGELCKALMGQLADMRGLFLREIVRRAIGHARLRTSSFCTLPLDAVAEPHGILMQLGGEDLKVFG
mmetsp:Transcript_7467/g.18828  ORF Transcript_7467/g.18828 Transcript_7467/m.18828 type:complete len:247 (+) Transcript_7467:240-980(+)